MSVIRREMSAAIRAAYGMGQEDETLRPLVLQDGHGHIPGRIRPGDAVIFFNMRGERERELTRALTDRAFPFFPVDRNLNIHLATMVQYDDALASAVAFPRDGMISDTLSEALSRQGRHQAKITEAEKSAHVGFFLNGRREAPFPEEERIIVPTRKDVALFDEAPRMSIDAITQAVIEKIHDPGCHFIFANFPNVDVVGHTENEAAVISAVEAVDDATGRLVGEARKAGQTMIITADHGSAEKWLHPDGTLDTGHTENPVPFILISAGKPVTLRPGGSLADVAPTALHLMGLEIPPLMTGKSLIDDPLPEQVSPSGRLLLLVLDGWGINPEKGGNLIAKAHTPVMDHLPAIYAHTALQAAGEVVGLPAGTAGNSEAGHLHIGAGRLIYSDRMKIDHAITDGSFFENHVFRGVMAEARGKGAALHLMGIVSYFSSHGSLAHLFALLEMARRESVPQVFIHAILGRRGELPESGSRYIAAVEKKCADLGTGRLTSVIGRHWSMDREENWDRIEKAYRMLVYGVGTPVIMAAL